MTQFEQMIAAFKDNGNMLTTGKMVKINPCEYRKIVSLIRQDPRYEIPDPILDKEHPSNNLYTLIEIDSEAPGSSLKPLKIKEGKCPPKPLSLEKQRTVDEYRQIQRSYPGNHAQWGKIETQIEKIIGKRIVKIKL